jgi:hypothetical protein
MDPVRESQESFDNMVDNEVDYSDDAKWVETAWRREDNSDVYQNGAGERRDDDGVESFEIHRENLSGPLEPALETAPEEEAIDVALITAERKLSCSNTQPQEAQKYRKGASSNDSGSLVKARAFQVYSSLTLSLRKPTTLRSSISRGPYKCDLGCGIPSFKCPKDFRRHTNDIHETRTRYRCPADGCKYGGATAGHSIKRKDNFRRHLQNIHNMHDADFLDIDLGWFSVVV